MVVLTRVNDERGLICFIGDTILDLGAKHHLVAVHEVKHDIVERGLESLLIYGVKVYQLVRGHLDSVIALDVEYHATQQYGVK